MHTFEKRVASRTEGKWFQVEECWGCAGIVDKVLLPRKKLYVYIKY